MSESGISRRQMLGGTAAIAAAVALPAITSVAPAVAAPTLTYPLACAPWVALDAKLAARQALEIYRGKHANQSG